MPSAILPVIERQTSDNPTHTVIWLHGLGADGHDFYPIVPELELSGAAVRFVFPHAPTLPVTVNGGYVMPAWYDILNIDGFDRQVDLAGIETSVSAVQALIATEIARGIPAQNIILAGFSQGGVIAYITGLTYPETLGGIMALSTYLPEPSHWALTEANRSIPIFAAHGRQDNVVPYSLGEKARDWLAQADYPSEWHSYAMPHSVCPEELRDISKWLIQRFN